MNILSVKYLKIMGVWLKKAMNLIKALSLLSDNLVSVIVRWSKFKIKQWFEKNKRNVENFIIAIPVFTLIYFIPYTFMLGNKERTIVGITLQIIAGAILILSQISSNQRISADSGEIGHLSAPNRPPPGRGEATPSSC